MSWPLIETHQPVFLYATWEFYGASSVQSSVATLRVSWSCPCGLTQQYICSYASGTRLELWASAKHELGVVSRLLGLTEAAGHWLDFSSDSATSWAATWRRHL
jgi:hypothetical protein